MPFQLTYFFVVAPILADHAVRRRCRCARSRGTAARARGGSALRRESAASWRRSSRDAWRAFTGSRAALVGLLYAAAADRRVRARASRCSRTSRSSSASTTTQVAQLNLVVDADLRAGVHRRRLAVRPLRPPPDARALRLPHRVPTLWLAWTMQQPRWIMPIDMQMRRTGRARRPRSSITFWIACIVYNVFQGLYYGIRSRALHGHHDAAPSRRRSSPPTWRC